MYELSSMSGFLTASAEFLAKLPVSRLMLSMIQCRAESPSKASEDLWQRVTWLNSAGTEPFIMSLPDDILLMIFDCLREDNSYQFTKTQQSGTKWLFMTNRRLRALAAPRLFGTLHIGPSWSCQTLARVLPSIEKRINVLSELTKQADIDLWDIGGVDSTMAFLLLSRLMQLLSVLPRLEQISLTLSSGFRDEFKAIASTQLVQVQKLIISPHTQWFIEACPNANSVSSNDWKLDTTDEERAYETILIDAAARLTGLHHFRIRSSSWTRRMLEDIEVAMPGLKSLELMGGLHGRPKNEIFTALRNFKHLETLGLVPGTYNLAQGWLSQQMLGHLNFTLRPVAHSSHWNQGTQHENEQNKMLAGELLAALPMLKVVRIENDFEARVIWRNDETSEVRVIFERRPRLPSHQEKYVELCTLLLHHRSSSQHEHEILSVNEDIPDSLSIQDLDAITLGDN